MTDFRLRRAGRTMSGEVRIMTVIEVERAQVELPSLIRGLAPGEEVTLTENGIPVARLTATTQPAPFAKRIAGLWAGKVTILAGDDDHLKDFAEYME